MQGALRARALLPCEAVAYIRRQAVLAERWEASSPLHRPSSHQPGLLVALDMGRPSPNRCTGSATGKRQPRVNGALRPRVPLPSRSGSATAGNHGMARRRRFRRPERTIWMLRRDAAPGTHFGADRERAWRAVMLAGSWHGGHGFAVAAAAGNSVTGSAASRPVRLRADGRRVRRRIGVQSIGWMPDSVMHARSGVGRFCPGWPLRFCDMALAFASTLGLAQRIVAESTCSPGASTGALHAERGDWPRLVELSARLSTTAVELAALSEHELPELMDYLGAGPALPFDFEACTGRARTFRSTMTNLWRGSSLFRRSCNVVAPTQCSRHAHLRGSAHACHSRTWTRASRMGGRSMSSGGTSMPSPRPAFASTSRTHGRSMPRWSLGTIYWTLSGAD